MRSGLNLQARKHSLIAPTNHMVDQMTCSEHFKTMAFPANKEVMIGDHELCKAEPQLDQTQQRSVYIPLTIIPRNQGGNNTKRLKVDFGVFVDGQKVRTPSFWSQDASSMIKQPIQLGGRRQDLTKASIQD